MHPNPRRILPIIVVILVITASVWYFTKGRAQDVAGPLTTSGTIESTQVTIASEIGGRVVEVMVNESDTVQSGQVLVQLNDELLQAQLNQAKAQWELAKANYDLILAGIPLEQRDLATAAAELEGLTAQQTLDSLHELSDMTAAGVQYEIAQIDKSLDLANQRLDTMNSVADPADIDSARATVVLAKDKLDKAIEDYAPYEKKPEDNLIRANLLAKMAEAQRLYDAAVSRLNNLLGKSNQYDLNLAETNQKLLEEQLADAQRRYDSVKDGPDQDAVDLAMARLKAADARLAAAKAEPTQEQIESARAQVDAAWAAIELVQTQMSKLTLNAPMDGTVLSRAIEPGEVVAPAAPLLVLANLKELTITIYLPEDRYAEVNLGDTATVTVDSFPGETFTARVVRIADRAEFTPRNVQTQEGRRSTVFAIKLAVDNPQGRLKPGMPADVAFK